MKICDNGIIREMTLEEVEEAYHTDPDAGEEDYIQVLDDLGVRLS